MDGMTYIYLGMFLALLASAGLAAAQLILWRWKKNYDAEWENEYESIR